MSLELLIEPALKSVAAAAGTLGLLFLLRARPASERAWIAHVGLLLCLAAPLVSLFGPDLKVAAPWMAPTPVQPIGTAAPAPSDGAFATFAAAPIEAPLAATLSAETAAVLLWAAVAGALAVGLVLGVARLMVLQRRAQVLTDPTWLTALAHAQRRMGFKHGAALLVSEELSSPVSWGFFRPTIVLSRQALDAPEQAEAIVAHELAHVVRLDWANLLLARIGAALLWWNPLVWVLARQAHQLREEAADDAVLRGDVDGPDYASLLVGVARHECRGVLMAANGVAPGRDSLKRRLVRVLDRTVKRDPVRPGFLAVGAAAALVAAGPLAAFTLTAPEPDLVEAGVAMAEASPVAIAAEAMAEQAVARAEADADAVAAADADSLRALEAVRSVEAVRGVAAVAPVAAVNPTVSVDPNPSPRVARGPISPETLTAMRIHGVTPEWIASLERAMPALRALSAGQLVGLAVHDVDAEYVRELARAGYRDLPYEHLVAFAVHDVNGAYVRELARAGYRDLNASTLVAFKIHDVDEEFVKEMATVGFKNLPPDRLLALRIHGVDAAYVREMTREGYPVNPDRIAGEKVEPPKRPAPPPGGWRGTPPPAAPEPPSKT